MKKYLSLMLLCVLCIAFGIIYLNQKTTLTADNNDAAESKNPESEKESDISDGEMPPLEDVLIGDDYYIALCEDGSVWSWGDNESKKLGVNANTIEFPQKIDIKERVIKIQDGGLNIWALTESGYVYVWGKAYLRETKHFAGLEDMAIPVKLENIPLIEDISAANNRAAVLDRNGELYLYGVTHPHWDIPAGTTEIILEQPPEEYRKWMTGVQEINIGSGRNHYFIREDGTVFSIMSRSAYEEGGYGLIFPNENEYQANITYYWLKEINNIEIWSEDDNSYYPVVFYDCEGLTRVERLSSDDYTMFLYKKDGTLWYWMSDRLKYHKYTWISSHADDGLEHAQGQFEPVDIAKILSIQEGRPVPRIIDICSNIENTLFLTSDGQVFLSSYVTDHTEDVEYYVKFNADSERLPAVEVRKDVPVKCMEFKQLDYHNIISIKGDGQYNFSAIDSMGNYYLIKETQECITPKQELTKEEAYTEIISPSTGL